MVQFSQVVTRQIGAAGACLILAACLVYELKARRPDWLLAALIVAVVIGAAVLAYALTNLQVTAV